ncbi:MAG: phenylalanine--tRNA ligase subunit alpha [Desulfarculaceae bacterium]|nr:phenylalanine--tRNA ligase subunit alpha [Desulfarculaceae bacterium]MCF8070955.1 phenylalanine--tRNA ligase subunit alpha [Desulfarculaceae bacterium]MCF8100543.1 phenylalanine--tRNA ligase subunit alpha [Desulfarculaceae bacterium]MCF8116569.1 phenylalanine--tRNA ligase subunit alpha [Desulfarculaceae bacterium]
MQQELIDLKNQALAEVSDAQSEDALEQLSTRYLGRKGLLTGLLRKTGTLPPEERPAFGQLANQVKKELEQALSQASERLSSAGRGTASRRGVDPTLPGIRPRRGRLHPITQTERLILEVFNRMGFQVVETPEVELDWYCFEALNMPPDHPARDMQDTFYISDQVVLRTHTSSAQIRTMEKEKPPLRIVCPGKAFRRDSDATHTPMFHQVEGLMVGEDITFAEYKGVLINFVHQIFGPEVPVRFRPSFFPFTEPSAEVDIGCVVCKGDGCRVCSHTGWLEILGSGMVDPNVFKNVGYDPDKVTGFAFGMGIERIAMLRWGIDDLRMFYDNDLRFIRQF